MADNDWKSRLGMVYSTDPGFNYETDDEPEAETLPAGAAGSAGVARPQAAGGQGRDPRQRLRGPRCRPSGTGAHAEIQVRRRRFGEGGRNHHPGRPPRPRGRSAHPQRLPLQKKPVRNVRRLLLLFALLCVLCGAERAAAQYYTWGSDPPQKWSAIRTPDVRMIYPDTVAGIARRTLFYIRTVRPDIGYGFRHGPMRIPFVMHPENFQSNGLVMYLPKRVEFLTSPAVDSYSMPWYKQLVAHEYRHAVQYNNLDRGVIRALSYVLGQQGSTIGLLCMPIWAMEGDAVMSETMMSSFGRGLQPSFSMAYRAMGSVGRDRRNIDRWFCGSYRDYIPDHYELGYQICSYAWERYGENVWDKVAWYGSRNPYVLATTRVALGKFYKTNVMKLFRGTFDELERYWDSLPKTGDSAVPLTALPEKNHTTYQWPPAAGRYGGAGAENRPRPCVAFRCARPPYGRGNGRSATRGWSRPVRRWPAAASGGPSTAARRFSNSASTRNLCYMDLADGVPPHGSTAAKYALSHGFGRGVRMGRVQSRRPLYGRGAARRGTRTAVRNARPVGDSRTGVGRSDGGVVCPRHGRQRHVDRPHRFRRHAPDYRRGLYHPFEPPGRGRQTLLRLDLLGSGRGPLLRPDGPPRISHHHLGLRLLRSRSGGRRVLLTTYDRLGYRVAEQRVAAGDSLLIPVTPSRLPVNLVNPPRRRWDVVNLDTVRYTRADSVGQSGEFRAKRYRKGPQPGERPQLDARGVQSLCGGRRTRDRSQCGPYADLAEPAFERRGLRLLRLEPARRFARESGRALFRVGRAFRPGRLLRRQPALLLAGRTRPAGQSGLPKPSRARQILLRGAVGHAAALFPTGLSHAPVLPLGGLELLQRHGCRPGQDRMGERQHLQHPADRFPRGAAQGFVRAGFSDQVRMAHRDIAPAGATPSARTTRSTPRTPISAT